MRTPPSTRPAENPLDAATANAANARVRAGPSGNAPASTATAAGTVSAAPTPCTARAVINQATSGLSPQASEAAPKTASPARSTGRAPSTSVRRPPSSRAPP